MAVVSARDNY